MDFATFRFWTGVLLLVDAGLALLWSEHLARVWPQRRVQRIALVEAAVALIILYCHFVVDPR